MIKIKDDYIKNYNSIFYILEPETFRSYNTAYNTFPHICTIESAHVIVLYVEKRKKDAVDKLNHDLNSYLA